MECGNNVEIWSTFDEHLDRLFDQTDLDRESRHLTLVCTAIPRNSVGVLARLLQRAMQDGVGEETIQEALLQSYLFAGYPAAIDAFETLSDTLKNNGTKLGRGAAVPVDEWNHLGQALCRRVYGERYERLRARMGELSAELADWMISEGYGKVLSRPGLPSRQRELCAVASLVALGRTNQLRAHLRGALNVGASVDEVHEVICQSWLLCGWPATLEALQIHQEVLRE